MLTHGFAALVPHVRHDRAGAGDGPHGDRVGHAGTRPQRRRPPTLSEYSTGAFIDEMLRLLDTSEEDTRRLARALARRLPVSSSWCSPTPTRDSRPRARRHRARLPERPGSRRLERHGRRDTPSDSTTQGPGRRSPGSEELDARVHRTASGLVLAARHVLKQHDGRVMESLPSITVPTLVVVGELTSRSSAARSTWPTRSRTPSGRDRGRRPRPARVSHPAEFNEPCCAIPRLATAGDDRSTRKRDGRARARGRAWLDEHWDPDLALLEWRRSSSTGLGGADVAGRWYGRGLPGWADAVVAEEFAPCRRRRRRRSAAAWAWPRPTILEHGSDDVQARASCRPTLTGEDTWCQLFSEPGSGSDLAGLDDARRARRRRVGRQRPEGVEHERPPRRLRHARSPAPTGTSPSTAASPTSCCRCTSPASRCGRCAR